MLSICSIFIKTPKIISKIFTYFLWCRPKHDVAKSGDTSAKRLSHIFWGLPLWHPWLRYGLWTIIYGGQCPLDTFITDFWAILWNPNNFISYNQLLDVSKYLKPVNKRYCVDQDCRTIIVQVRRIESACFRTVRVWNLFSEATFVSSWLNFTMTLQFTVDRSSILSEIPYEITLVSVLYQKMIRRDAQVATHVVGIIENFSFIF